ncbi:Uncharacterised protein [Shigella sonnei]|nr:Uncharacterised protein [Shigella sonnei]CSS49058.1 Uncharacterised protein [Shigella sonnei]
MIFRPRQGANAVAPQQLFNALRFHKITLRFANRESVTILQ